MLGLFMESENGQEEPVVKKLSLWRAAKAIFWGFFGVRRGKDHAADAANLTPLQIVISGIIGGVLFVVTLLVVVNLVIK